MAKGPGFLSRMLQDSNVNQVKEVNKQVKALYLILSQLTMCYTFYDAHYLET